MVTTDTPPASGHPGPVRPERVERPRRKPRLWLVGWQVTNAPYYGTCLVKAQTIDLALTWVEDQVREHYDDPMLELRITQLRRVQPDLVKAGLVALLAWEEA
jgi:hypothetical protein